LLIAILLPALGAAQKTARSTQCLSNTKGMTTGYIARTADYKGEFSRYKAPGSGGLWVFDIDDYYAKAIQKGAHVSGYDLLASEDYLCPESTIQIDVQTKSGNTFSTGSSDRAWVHIQNPGAVASSYGMNGYLYSSIGGQNFPTNVGFYGKEAWPDFIDKVVDTTRMPLFLDSVWVDGWPRHTDPKPATFENFVGGLNPNMQRFSIDRHGSGNQNTSFLDGHAETVFCGDLWSMQWNKNFVPENP